MTRNLPAAVVPLRPQRLRPGGRVVVVAPAGPFDSELLEQGVAIWRDRGFDVYLPPGLDERSAYLAGTDAHRADLLHEALDDPATEAIVAARGGYGSLRLLDRFDFDRAANHPKIWIGFSDLTALQLELWRRTSLVTFSGPMIAGTQLGRLDQGERDVYFATLTDTAPPPPLRGDRARVVRPGDAVGPFLGGNLTLLSHLAAAGHLPSLAGAVLFFEDINEPPYRLDRMLTALKLGGHLEGIAGFVGGDFGTKIEPGVIDAILIDRLGDLCVPIVAGLDVGHGRRNRLVPLGVPVRLTTQPPEVTFLEGGVC